MRNILLLLVIFFTTSCVDYETGSDEYKRPVAFYSLQYMKDIEWESTYSDNRWSKTSYNTLDPSKTVTANVVLIPYNEDLNKTIDPLADPRLLSFEPRFVSFTISRQCSNGKSEIIHFRRGDSHMTIYDCSGGINDWKLDVGALNLVYHLDDLPPKVQRAIKLLSDGKIEDYKKEVVEDENKFSHLDVWE